MKSWDAIIVGGGIIGLSLAIALRKQGLRVLVLERGEPGREASHAAAGMLVDSGIDSPPALRGLARESARMYPEFVHELKDESGVSIDFREHGTILISEQNHFPEGAQPLSLEQLQSLEPALKVSTKEKECAAFLSERSVDPRTLMSALIKAARHRGVDISSGSKVESVIAENDRVAGVKTDKASYSTPIAINCAGAWAGQIGQYRFPVRPVKGQMLAVVGGPSLKHVVRGDDVYLVPRSDGRIVIGSTLEDAGFDKTTDVNTIEKMFHDAVKVVPDLVKARQHDAWAGLRPAMPDDLPILGATSTLGYFVATGHYRDGILLAPVTAKVMAEVILSGTSSCDLKALSAGRFL